MSRGGGSWQGGSCLAIPSHVAVGVQSKSQPWTSTAGDSPPAPVVLSPSAAKGAVPKCPQACTSTPIIPSQLAAQSQLPLHPLESENCSGLRFLP